MITSLGKLAAGADVASLGLSGAGVGGDVEMVDAPPVEENVAAAPAVSGKGQGQGQGQQGQGGKGKKKGGKGKR